MAGWLKRRRRREILERPFPGEWEAHLSNLPIDRLLPEADRQELRRHMLVLLEEKLFEGCGGQEITEEIRVTIAAYAALLLLHRETDYYPQLTSILVYPEAYTAPGERHVGDYLVEEGPEVREGESWYRGAMVLSWSDILRGVRNPQGGENVVIHEFAHQLDDESGSADGTPELGNRRLWRRWVRICQLEYEALVEADDMGRRTLIDPYGAENPSEFFAVVTESFFLRPEKMRQRHPELYELFAEYYRQDPATWGQPDVRER